MLVNFLPSWWCGVNFQKYFFLKINMIYPVLHRNLFATSPPLMGMEVSINFVARNWEKYPDLDRKVMFIKAQPLWAGEEMGELISKNIILLGIEKHIQICKKVMFAKPTPHVGWGVSVYKRLCFLGSEFKIQISAQHLCSPAPTSHGGRSNGQFTKLFCAMNCI